MASAGAPDLRFTSVTPTSVTGSPGGTVRATFTLRNSGNATAAATTIRVFQSTNSSISTSDTEIGRGTTSSLSAGQSRSITGTVTLSSQASGTFYFGLCADRVSGESNTQNNCSRGVRVTVGGSGAPDLEFTGGVSPRTVVVTTGTSFQIRATLANTGTARAAATKIRTFVSSNPQISTSDRETGTAGDIRALGASETLNLTITHTFTGSGSAYIGYCVDAVAGESDTSNNCSQSFHLTLLSSSSQKTGKSAADSVLVLEHSVLRAEPGSQEDESVDQDLVVGATITVSERSKS